MEYILWVKDEYAAWQPTRCPDLTTASVAILEALKQGKEPLLTAEVPYKFNVKIEEGKIGEATQSKTKPDKGAGATSEGETGRGDAKVTNYIHK